MRWRLVAVLVGLTAVVLLVQDIPLAIYLRGTEENRIITELQRDAFVIAGRSQEALATQPDQTSSELTSMVTAYSQAEDSDVVIINKNGVLIASSEPGAELGRSFESRPEIQAALSGETTNGERDSTTLGTRILYVAVPVLSGPNTLGAVRLTFPAEQLDARVNDRVRGITVVALLTLLVSIVIAFLLAGTITRPLRRLQLATAELASGDLTARADTRQGAPELKALAADLNTMANRLDHLVEAQKSFAGDASHQLRTPLTGLRLRLDEAAESLETDPLAAAESLDSAREETERLQHIIDGLLRLARAEGTGADCISVDLGEIVADRIEVWRPLAEEHRVEITYEGPPSASVKIIPGGAEQIVDNYVDNALSVSPPDTTIIVSIEVSDHEYVTLRVQDSGPGLTSEQRARAFDRFWRGRKDNQGTGLGLAIVSQLADASGAAVQLRESPTGGIEAVAMFRRS